jgi:hypothetical protein
LGEPKPSRSSSPSSGSPKSESAVEAGGADLNSESWGVVENDGDEREGKEGKVSISGVSPSSNGTSATEIDVKDGEVVVGDIST